MPPAEVSSDGDLIIASRNGDLYAHEMLIQRFQQVLYLNVQRYTNETFLAQDIVQETVVRAFQALDRLHGPGRFGAWLKPYGQEQISISSVGFTACFGMP